MYYSMVENDIRVNPYFVDQIQVRRAFFLCFCYQSEVGACGTPYTGPGSTHRVDAKRMKLALSRDGGPRECERRTGNSEIMLFRRVQRELAGTEGRELGWLRAIFAPASKVVPNNIYKPNG